MGYPAAYRNPDARQKAFKPPGSGRRPLPRVAPLRPVAVPVEPLPWMPQLPLEPAPPRKPARIPGPARLPGGSLGGLAGKWAGRLAAPLFIAGTLYEWYNMPPNGDPVLVPGQGWIHVCGPVPSSFPYTGGLQINFIGALQEFSCGLVNQFVPKPPWGYGDYSSGFYTFRDMDPAYGPYSQIIESWRRDWTFPHPDEPQWKDPLGAPRPRPAPQPEPRFIPAVDPMAIPIGRPMPTPAPFPFPAIPARQPNPFRDPKEQTQRGNGPARAPKSEPFTSFSPGRAPQQMNPGRRPPGPREKEPPKRIFAAGPKELLTRFLGGLGEMKDLTDAIYDAVPKRLKPKGFDRPFTPQEKLLWLYQNPDAIDIRRALYNWLLNEGEDRALGKLGRLSAAANRARNASAGNQQGDADTPPPVPSDLLDQTKFADEFYAWLSGDQTEF